MRSDEEFSAESGCIANGGEIRRAVVGKSRRRLRPVGARRLQCRSRRSSDVAGWRPRRMKPCSTAKLRRDARRAAASFRFWNGGHVLNFF